MQNLVVPQSQATMAQVHSLVNTRKLPKGLEDVFSELKELEITGPALSGTTDLFSALSLTLGKVRGL